jgi:hypothetical protein
MLDSVTDYAGILHKRVLNGLHFELFTLLLIFNLLSLCYYANVEHFRLIFVTGI